MWWRLAAEEAMEGDDLEAAADRARQGLRCVAPGQEGELLVLQGRLRLLEGEAEFWLGKNETARSYCRMMRRLESV